MNNWLKNNQSLNVGSIAQLLFKQNCLLCSASTHGEISICNDCLQDISYAPGLCCPQCGLTSQGEVCGKCLNKPPHYDNTYALFTYAYPIDALIQHYKYNNALYLSKTLGRLLTEKIAADDIDLLIPMPLHPARIKERGFNQSLEVAKVVAKQRNITLDVTSCTRVRNTCPQASLPLKERTKNIKGAFQCAKNLTGKNIAIIDDVMTTGASLNELAKTLKKSGASGISNWVLARTL